MAHHAISEGAASRASRQECFARRECFTPAASQVRWASRLEAHLDVGLQLIEQAHCSSHSTAQRAVDKWKGQLVAVVPADHQFVGRALAFSVADPEQARVSVAAPVDDDR